MKKKILITGASRGLGRGLSKHLSNDYCVTGVARNLPKSETDLDDFSAFHKCDLTNSLELNKLIQLFDRQDTKFDGIVCNLGSGKSKTFMDTDLDEFLRVFHLNFFSSVSLIQKLLPNFLHEGASIVCISSICGIDAIAGAPIAYSTAKASLNHYVKCCSSVVADYGVRINSISPGNLYFDGSVWQQKINEDSEAVKKILRDNVPLNKFGQLEDVANMCEFLVSDKSTFITGANFIVDGGQTT